MLFWVISIGLIVILGNKKIEGPFKSSNKGLSGKIVRTITNILNIIFKFFSGFKSAISNEDNDDEFELIEDENEIKGKPRDSTQVLYKKNLEEKRKKEKEEEREKLTKTTQKPVNATEEKVLINTKESKLKIPMEKIASLLKSGEVTNTPIKDEDLTTKKTIEYEKLDDFIITSSLIKIVLKESLVEILEDGKVKDLGTSNCKITVNGKTYNITINGNKQIDFKNETKDNGVIVDFAEYKAKKDSSIEFNKVLEDIDIDIQLEEQGGV